MQTFAWDQITIIIMDPYTSREVFFPDFMLHNNIGMYLSKNLIDFILRLLIYFHAKPLDTFVTYSSFDKLKLFEINFFSTFT